MIHKLLLYIAFLASVMIAVASPVHAVTTPIFPSCEAPSGTLIAQYDSGTHGIPGRSAAYTGSDAVYELSSSLVLQCFCPSEGSEGIQSNWWKYSELSDSDIKVLEKTGWIHVPNGLLWGLDESSYLVLNKNYSCRGTGGGSGASSENSSSGGTGGSSEVIGASGQVLGVSTFAQTGNIGTILAFLGIGALAIRTAVRK